MVQNQGCCTWQCFCFGNTSPASRQPTLSMDQCWPMEHPLSWSCPPSSPQRQSYLLSRTVNLHCSCTRKFKTTFKAGENDFNFKEHSHAHACIHRAYIELCISHCPRPRPPHMCLLPVSLTPPRVSQQPGKEGHGNHFSCSCSEKKPASVTLRIKLLFPALSKTYTLLSVWYLLLIGTIQCFVPVPFQLLLYINFD